MSQFSSRLQRLGNSQTPSAAQQVFLVPMSDHNLPESAVLQPCSMSDWQHPVQQQNPSQQQDSKSGEADPTVLAFAAAVAELLMRHIAKQMPPSVAEALRQMVQQQIAQETAEAAAAGRKPTMTATLQQLLPQLSQIVAHANRLGPSFGSAAAVAANAVLPMLPGSSPGGVGAGHLNRFDPANSQQQQQQQQQQQRTGMDGASHEGSPTSMLHSSAGHTPTALAPSSACAHGSARRQLLFEPPPASSAPGVAGSSRYLAEPLLYDLHSQQQQQQQLTSLQLDQQLQVLQQQLLSMIQQQGKQQARQQQYQLPPQRQQDRAWVGPQWDAAPALACSDCSSSCA